MTPNRGRGRLSIDQSNLFDIVHKNTENCIGATSKRLVFPIKIDCTKAYLQY